MDLYPAIDLRDGRVVRLHQGDYGRETVYGDDPVAVAKRFEDAGAPWIHVVDLDAARRTGSNRALVTAVADAVFTPVQSGGGVRDGSLLDAGVARVVVGSAAVDDPDLVRRLTAAHPGRVAVGLDHRDGEVRTRGWEEGSGRKLLDVVVELADAGPAAFVVTDIARDGVLEGPDVDGYRQLSATTDVPIVASGGVGTLDDLRALRDVGVSGVIVGKALYEGRFTVEEGVACAQRE
ncbi:MAG: 1-(5-phosphoribosyl)-5-[(5-phosphoribosylamino)methylideneamino]imidazole-4-carboxamide isomerase [Acidimicrobiales bacterium]